MSAAHDDGCLTDTLTAFEKAVDRTLDSQPGRRQGPEWGLMRGEPAA
jgi:hypothetical protein